MTQKSYEKNSHSLRKREKASKKYIKKSYIFQNCQNREKVIGQTLRFRDFWTSFLLYYGRKGPKMSFKKVYQKILYFSKWPKSQKSDRVDPTISRFLDLFFAISWAERSKNELFSENLHLQASNEKNHQFSFFL